MPVGSGKAGDAYPAGRDNYPSTQRLSPETLQRGPNLLSRQWLGFGWPLRVPVLDVLVMVRSRCSEIPASMSCDTAAVNSPKACVLFKDFRPASGVTEALYKDPGIAQET